MRFKPTGFIKSFSLISVMVLSQIPLLAYAEATIRPTCDSGAGPNSGFFLTKQNFLGGNIAVLYPKARGGLYDNSQLGRGRHCLPLPAHDASIHVCVRNQNTSYNCIDSHVDVDQAVEMTCWDDGWEYGPPEYVSCRWNTTPQKPW